MHTYIQMCEEALFQPFPCADARGKSTLVAHRKLASRAESRPRTEFSQALTCGHRTGKVSSGDRERRRRREGGNKGARLRERRKGVTGGWREGLAGRGREQAFAFSVS